VSGVTFGFKLVQHLAPECLRFSGEPAALGVGETKAPTTQALLEHAVLFLEILDHVQLMAVDPTGEHQEDYLKRQKQWRHSHSVYRPFRHPTPFSRVAARQIAPSDFFDEMDSPCWQYGIRVPS
jgi:hypothetical protein